MIVPEYWAEAQKRHRDEARQITIRRFGWSNESEADALMMAEARAADALAQHLRGETVDRRERKAAYNGAFGVPIREEVLSRHGPEVVTRNSYGAQCLNTPRALFADIDFEATGRARNGLIAFGILVAGSAVVGLQLHRWALTAGLFVVSLMLASTLASIVRRVAIAARGGASKIARARVLAHVSGRPGWKVRLYRTPAGLRLLVTHQPFDPDSREVQEFFAAVGADPIYVRMCLNQRCFRARLSGKPWRMGITGHMRPRPGLWPVDPARRYLRDQWIAQYEKAVPAFAACHFVESIGSGIEHQDLLSVIDLHDRMSNALRSDLPLA